LPIARDRCGVSAFTGILQIAGRDQDPAGRVFDCRLTATGAATHADGAPTIEGYRSFCCPHST